jgi:hypothetical protein
MLYSWGSLSSVWYLFADYTERAFLLPPQLFKHPLRYKMKLTLYYNKDSSIDIGNFDVEIPIYDSIPTKLEQAIGLINKLRH